ncbi:MAG: hypothetical protein Q7J80_01040, partial [Anaerolineales bacterium]|nr:hypothetical protein [Anaerolineales bacterium]
MIGNLTAPVPPLSLQEEFAGVAARAVVEPIESLRVWGEGVDLRHWRAMMGLEDAMNKTLKQTLFWTPRVAGILFILF